MAFDLLKLGDDTVSRALKLGASAAESFLVSDRELSIEVANQEVETMKVAESAGLGMRVFKDGRMGFAYTADLSKTGLDFVAAQAMENAKRSAVDEHNVLPEPVGNYTSLDLFDPEIDKTPVETKISLAKEIERQARQYDKRVTITERCAYQDSTYRVAIVNSHGISEEYKGAYCGAYSFLVAEENDEQQTGFGMQYRLKYNQLNPKEVGHEGAEKAVRMLGAKEISTQRATVVLDPYVATNFLGVIAPALSAESVQKGKSLFAGKVGQAVGARLLTIIDDGAMKGGVISAPMDGEGVPAGKTVLIDKGDLQGFLHNTYTAAKDGVASTGNGTRGSFKGTPEIGTTNFYIAPGETPRDKLLAEIDKGLYITEVMGMHTANPISGDFSVGASGLWIENGKFTHPVRGVAIAGNVMDLLKSIDCIGSDMTFFVGKGSPTVRIARMTISGA
ncbi:TldD/PmbA family protein [Metallumcola ferriviriculae]|uniref:TldD/PmbA family protein n=1 Tax=Metallumcola ferriviriculae TaxID=3039180 RepID=A0AAU0UQ94_9FIRM|nr:TldD/PmbA family protein [Desulfitibacteraceae bacterium MK1]